MGIPYVDAPGEAEASCAALVKAGKVFATASEDMDSLTFGSSVVLLYMTASGKFRKKIAWLFLRIDCNNPYSVIELFFNSRFRGQEASHQRAQSH